MAEEKQRGLSGYRGYEYQIVASIWISLSLMLESGRVTQVVVEPENHEDLEAEFVGTVSSPDQESSTVVASDGQSMRAIYQMKTLSSRHWSLKALGNVIGQGTSVKGADAGSRHRTRALEMLLNDASLSYTLVTDARVNDELAGLVRTTIPLGRDDAGFPVELLADGRHDLLATLRGRLHILHDLSAELLGYRIRDLLTKKGGVPHGKVAGCMAALKDAFRLCMLGKRDTRFTAIELSAMLERHGARPASGPIPGYVPPAIAAQAASTLREQRCVVIVGAPDIGKASLADYLAASFELDSLPCPVIPLEDLAGLPVRLRNEGPALLVVKDGWAKYGAVHSHAWTNFPEILAQAPRDKFFIVTCDLDVYRRLPDHMRTRLQCHRVKIEEEHYDDKARWQIVLNQAGLTSWQLKSLEAAREAVLRDVAEPFTLNLFGTLVREHAQHMIQPTPADDWESLPFDLPQADPNSRLLEDLAERALQETVGYRTVRLISAYHHMPWQHAALVYGVYVAFAQNRDSDMERIAEQVAHKTGVRLHGEAFIEYLVNTGVAQRWENHRVTLERTSLDALRRLVVERRLDVHPVFVAVVLNLAETMDQANFASRLERIVTLITEIYPDVPPHDSAWNKVAQVVDAQLLRALDVRDYRQFIRNVEASMDWGFGKSALSRLMYTLHPRRIPWVDMEFYDFLPSSHHAWNAVVMELPDYDLNRFVCRFIVEFMPYSLIDYSAASKQFVSFLRASGRYRATMCIRPFTS